MKKTIVLCILDGWGLGNFDESNPIYTAHPQNINYIQANYSAGALQAHGVSVGLPWGDPGSSEAGHLTLGVGKVLYHHYPKITMAIEDGTFFENKALNDAFAHAKKLQSAVHAIGLLTAGIEDASLEHLFAIIDMARNARAPHLYLHLITDGINSPKQSSEKLIKKLRAHIKEKGTGTIATLIGRFYALDEEHAWDKTANAYAALIGNAERTCGTPEEAIEKAYKINPSDEFIPPTAIGERHPIQSGDALIFFNFREDGMRQISEPFTDRDFKHFPTVPLGNLFITTLTTYHVRGNSHTAFPSDAIETHLSKIFAENGKTQLKVTESRRESQLTYFFSGLSDETLPKEYRVIIPSDTSPHPEQHPEMNAKAITDRIIMSLNEGGFDFIVTNYPNADVMAHSGNIESAKEAIQTIDREIGRLMRSVLESDHTLLITADHSNAEYALDLVTGKPDTGHNMNPIPIYLVDNRFKKATPLTNPYNRLEVIGILADVAPTVLELAGIPVPPTMTGQSLLSQLT